MKNYALEVAQSLQCLSAGGLFRTFLTLGRLIMPEVVFSAFRQVVCLGPDARAMGYCQAGIVFSAFRQVVCLGPTARHAITAVKISLQCLSAGGLFRTALASAETALKKVSSVPFGRWSV